MTEARETECERLRQLYNDDATTLEFKQHSEGCTDCREWLAQIGAITEATAAIPQFDVPEALTQRIMQSVGREPAGGPSWVMLTVVAVAAAAAFVYLGLYTFDTEGGWLVWALSLLCMIAVKFLVQGIQGISEEPVAYQ